MPDFTVLNLGTDTSGRTIWMTQFMHDWWECRVANLGFRPTVIQGAFQVRNGGGAEASDGAHDLGGCIDVRTRDLTTAQVDAMVWECRTHAGAAIRRDLSIMHGGMDPHCHITLGADSPLSPMAQILWSSYLAGGDGLAGFGSRPSDAPDYERRPNPLVTTPPEEDMPLNTDDLAKIRALVADEAQKAVARVLDAPVNSQSGKDGDPDFADMTLRKLVKALYRRAVS